MARAKSRALPGPRWDTARDITKQLNETLDAAKKVEGDARAALVRTGCDWLRSWCEAFTEMELLQEVTQRYQSNLKMTTLPKRSRLRRCLKQSRP